MHEMSLMRGLMRQVLQVAEEQGAERVTRVDVTLGALSHMSADHFCEHFEQAAAGTLAEGASLQAHENRDAADPHAEEIVLEAVEVETPE